MKPENYSAYMRLKGLPFSIIWDDTLETFPVYIVEMSLQELHLDVFEENIAFFFDFKENYTGLYSNYYLIEIFLFDFSEMIE